MSDQSRPSVFMVLRWLEALYVENVLIENVPEFRSWGPLGANGRPMKSKRGELFRQFIHSMEALGYRVEHRILNAADYGDPTTRRRLFIMARRGNCKIEWPEATHSASGRKTLFGDRKKWRAAREVIDWDIEGQSILNRKRPLAPKTLARIEAGLRKFGGLAAEPFLVRLRNHADAQSVDEPAPTVTAGGTHIGVCQPFVMSAAGPVVDPRSVDNPMATVLTRDRLAVVEPFILPHRQFERMDVDGVDDTMRTVTALNGGNSALVEAFLVKVNHGPDARPWPSTVMGRRSYRNTLILIRDAQDS